ncbi:GNAT family N-acetyltransferase [Hyunsoonleella flava]|uniref:GNAT family N-acetyltransferase n=1 Tax=Hyunsoonleella flava TaxID=2527939 RepID=A0A4Q9FDD6_9FLAO|nr:GNAT family N-acetyltransferase [Hyunsoonleella flava]TBM99401.1 GNAT family N-acetyltransferase [Hyunsoonleella flava]
MIRKAILEDVDEILEITKASAKHMIFQNIFQWNEFYPNAAAFEIDIKRDECYVLEINNAIIGCITISTLMDEEYIPILWLTPNKNNIYIHRLAVHPNYQGKGHAQELLSFAENYAVTKRYTSIRLDTFSQNKRNQKFYELRGYKKLGDIYFPKQSEYPFHCYELVL